MNGQDANTFGTQLRRQREAVGLTQEQLAERAGLTAQGIGALETGKRRYPYPQTVRALADALGLAASERAGFLASAPRRPQVQASSGNSYPLPLPLTRIIGRERELHEISGLFSQGTRLVTLTGPGGVGKSRLALEAARSASYSRPDGVCFVMLAPLSDSRLLFQTIAETLHLSDPDNRDFAAVVRSFLERRRMLLILDNFEHLLDAAPDVAKLLAHCPDLTVLVTSRAPLRVRGERQVPVNPLQLPDVTQLTEPETTAVASIELFVERAAEASPGFALDPGNAPAVAAICRRLEGIPLAIELAAAGIRTLSPAHLLNRLDRLLPQLADGPRDLPERQQTMSATIGWSYGLLSDPARTLFRMLSGFAGGWDLATASQLAAGSFPGLDDILDPLTELIDNALLMVESLPDGETTRYRMLEPIREYADEMLVGAGEYELVHDRHAHIFLDFAELAGSHLRGPDQVLWTKWLETEHDNIRAAMNWLIGRAAAEEAARLVWALWLFWWSSGYHREGHRWTEQVIQIDGPVSHIAETRLQYVMGLMLYRLGSFEQPVEYFDRSLEGFRTLEDGHGAGLASAGAGLSRVRAGDAAAGERMLEESVALLQQSGDRWGAAQILTYLGIIPFNRGDYIAAMERFKEGLGLARALGNPQLLYISLYDVGLAAQALGDSEHATASYREAFALAVEVGDTLYEAYCLEGLAGVAGLNGDSERAANLYGAARARLDSIGAPTNARATDPGFLDTAYRQARNGLDEAQWSSSMDAGESMDPARILTLALDEG